MLLVNACVHLLECVCMRALVLRASLLALINNSPVLLVSLSSSLPPLPQMPPLSSLFALTPSLLCPSPNTFQKHTPHPPHLTIILIPYPVLQSPKLVQASVHIRSPPPLLRVIFVVSVIWFIVIIQNRDISQDNLSLCEIECECTRGFREMT